MCRHQLEPNSYRISVMKYKVYSETIMYKLIPVISSSQDAWEGCEKQCWEVLTLQANQSGVKIATNSLIFVKPRKNTNTF